MQNEKHFLKKSKKFSRFPVSKILFSLHYFYALLVLAFLNKKICLYVKNVNQFHHFTNYKSISLSIFDFFIEFNKSTSTFISRQSWQIH